MNDLEIRKFFHLKKLAKYHSDPNSLVLDELGLEHGKCRADIAVINGHLVGYEIKSDADSLRRLKGQVQSYTNVFDRVAIILSESHINEAQKIIPKWWGVFSAKKSRNESVRFEVIRPQLLNPNVDDFSVAQLLWLNEARSILIGLGAGNEVLRKNRTTLYNLLIDSVGSITLREMVRAYLRKRKNWRHHESPSQHDGLSQPTAKLRDFQPQLF